MSWIYLILGGLFEIGWPLGLKLAHSTTSKTLWITFSVISMTVSGVFLFLAQRHIPIGTAYAVWTGIGACGTFLLGILFFHDPVSTLRMVSVLLIVAGIIGLKLAS